MKCTLRWCTPSEVVRLRLDDSVSADTVTRQDIIEMVVNGAPTLSADDRASIFAMLPAVKVGV